MTNALLIIGIMWMVFGVIITTNNFRSSLSFKVFPFLSGLFTSVYAANQLGWLHIF